jgi:biotin carboxyl carrier protein
MSEVLRRTELRGDDLHTNMSMHYGLLNWLLGKGVLAEPSTRFMASYLGAVGELQRTVVDVDLDIAAQALLARIEDAEGKDAFASKQTLLLRPLERLLANPHWLAGFLGRFDGVLWTVEDGEVVFADNPVRFLQELYHYLNMEEVPEKPPSEKIWDHDDEVLQASLAFYAAVSDRAGVTDWKAVDALFDADRNDAIANGDDGLWRECVASHQGFQIGLELLLLIPRIGVSTGFLEIGVSDELVPVFPEKFQDADNLRVSTRALAPPPKASSDEIVTPMGGAFFPREAPHLPLLIDEGEHFEEGQPLFIIEVMKMFNKVLAPFSGVVTANLMKDREGAIVAKGELIFKIEPDERIEEVPPEVIASWRRDVTLSLL